LHFCLFIEDSVKEESVTPHSLITLPPTCTCDTESIFLSNILKYIRVGYWFGLIQLEHGTRCNTGERPLETHLEINHASGQNSLSTCWATCESISEKDYRLKLNR
jgi:hypothetical protein